MGIANAELVEDVRLLAITNELGVQSFAKVATGLDVLYVPL